MSSPPAIVTVHGSQFPAKVRLDLLRSLRERRVNHKFHYESHKQAQKWLRLHDAFAPSRNNPECAACYEGAFRAAASLARTSRAHLVGLGCGGGQKDLRLLRALRAAGAEAAYMPVDVSVPLALVAREAVLAEVPASRCFPVACDFAAEPDLSGILDAQMPSDAIRLFTFFGMLPNFEPGAVWAWLGRLVRPGDLLLASANLTPGTDYAEGMRAVLPQYDNDLTRDWLMTFLLDLGVEPDDGTLRFEIEIVSGEPELRRLAAWFEFVRSRGVRVDDEVFEFRAGDRVRLFFSVRHTLDTMRESIRRAGFQVRGEWAVAGEGVYLLAKEDF